ncbi:potassium transporter 5 isoform X2 [Arachis ipaensis]|uniref:potassium transporter 5 isoform X2 n=1 Tax=Arachis ipaensis TaxID=130454 RepID=UPI000A2B5EFD|nr:potassium transporter 5 isoform X2 [Arachis ipaensis]XP_025634459.1 potassium transporter 5 isoform X2 [Arachis hypogaea]
MASEEQNHATHQDSDHHGDGLTGKNKILRRHDSLDMESRIFSNSSAHSKGPSMSMIMHLAFQSIGIVYGDIGTSPLYVYSSTFTDGIKHNDDILGVLSIIFYTITLIPLVKYVLIVLKANDNGDGGTFALYSLICRYAKVSLTPNQQIEDAEVSNYQLDLPENSTTKRASMVKSKLENSYFAKLFLLLVTMLGTSMVIGDGVLTPCISVLSAVGGLKEATSKITDERVVGISIGILICLFMVQRFGTDKVGYSFAPIICVWFLFIGGIGVYNFIKYDPIVIKALNPAYIVYYFRRNKKDAWISLGGVVLSITDKLYWPMFVVAVAAAIIASQAMISGTFSIIQQSLALGCFPRVKVVHTSTKYEGQVYVPEINFILMIACVAVTAGFKTTTKIGNAYGIAVVFVMTLTSALLVLVMIMIWKTNLLLIISYVLIIGSVELLYLSSVLYKFKDGGYLPLAFALFLMSIMYIWNDVYRKKYYYELDHKISPQSLKEIIANEKRLHRIPGFAIFYSELVQGIPPIFKHYVSNIPALHSVVVFISIKSLPISKISMEERFIFRRVEHDELKIFRCVVRYGYTDVRDEKEPLEDLLVRRLKSFVGEVRVLDSSQKVEEERMSDDGGEETIIEEIEKGLEGGIVHLIGESEVVASKGSGIGKKILINYAYNFLKKNLKQGDKVFDIPHERKVKVGMTYEL